MRILGIESSCDETAATVVQDGRQVLSNVIATSLEEHKLYGGVVPEIASRRHAESISGVVRQALADANCDMSGIDAIAVTYAPGLIGALLVGGELCQGAVYGYKYAPGAGPPPAHHVAANYITGDLQPPFLCLVVSGGHSHIVAVEDYTTYKVLGKTRDDAAGEALDKAGRTLGLPYPGGISIDKIAPTGDENAFAFPHPRLDTPYDFSFSGLKTAVINIVHRMEQKGETLPVADLGASFQKGVTDCLVEKLEKAATDYGYTSIALAGGVSANSRLRRETDRLCRQKGWRLHLPALKYCGDNGAMVGAQGYYEYVSGVRAQPDLNAYATMPIDRPTF